MVSFFSDGNVEQTQNQVAAWIALELPGSAERYSKRLGTSSQDKRVATSHEQWVKEGRTFTLAAHSKEAPFYISDALKKLLEEENEEK